MVPTGALLETMLPLLTVLALLVSVATVRRLHRPERRWGDVARSRLVMGVPWGSLVVIGLVCGVYLLVQDGLTAFDDPVTIPYRAYSYFYPLGMLTASFSHAGPNHLIGNLSGTIVVAPIAEYAWGHYPTGRDEASSGSWRTDPWVRALVIFPLAVVGIGTLTSLFALGPVIGFSGVVFAFAAFALVHYPIATIVGVLGIQGVLVTLYRALQTPIGVYVAESSPPTAPSWAGIAIQGHALGFLIGLVLGIAVLRKRGLQPDPLKFWLATLLYGFAQGLWQIYWFGSEDTFILFQGPGVLIVTALALVITLAVTASRRPVAPRRLEGLLARVRRKRSKSSVERSLEIAHAAGNRATATTSRLERISALASAERSRGSGRLSAVDQQRAASVVVLLVLAIVAGMAIPVNLFVLADTTTTADTAIEIEDYTVHYAEGVENELTAPVRVGPLEDAVSIESSGVIVASERRQLWLESVPARQLAFTGEESVVVGGPGWRETVHVERTGWEPVGNDTVYRIDLWADGDDRQLAHESNGSRADVRIDNRTVTITVEDGTFILEVESLETDTVETTAMPEDGESTAAGGLTFDRDEGTVYARSDGTRVAVASAETYD
ncbi:rhomboid family intramembrane serine protease [Natronorubrum thiooxidans]|uniref:Rhomboid family protein n=1 Tax=Natronorubrum thiooxidans TaxID=308853 RepID=A0A1N7E6N1_9EURY|nr:rhomboid family intramembrane serine protease [Natronorubrum thiooxidans]SIR83721.1 Rhomboid family protein [Natronorubrum thiooxidans]